VRHRTGGHREGVDGFGLIRSIKQTARIWRFAAGSGCGGSGRDARDAVRLLVLGDGAAAVIAVQ